MAAQYDLISGFVYEEREVGSERNTVHGGNQDGEWICPHEREGDGAIFLAVEFGYVHFQISKLTRVLAGPRGRERPRHTVFYGCCGWAMPWP
jgi:hypothetical protein